MAMTSRVYALPLFEPLTSGRLLKFAHLTLGGLNAALSCAVAMTFPASAYGGAVHDESEAMAADIVQNSVRTRTSAAYLTVMLSGSIYEL